MDGCPSNLFLPKQRTQHCARKLTETFEDVSLNAGKLVLSPTRTYAPIIKKILDAQRDDIHGMVHCSGGAQTKVLHFVDNVHVIKNNLFETPALFEMIQKESIINYVDVVAGKAIPVSLDFF